MGENPPHFSMALQHSNTSLESIFFFLSKLSSLFSSILSRSLYILDLYNDLRFVKLVFRNLLSKSFSRTLAPHFVMRIFGICLVLHPLGRSSILKFCCIKNWKNSFNMRMIFTRNKHQVGREINIYKLDVESEFLSLLPLYSQGPSGQDDIYYNVYQGDSPIVPYNPRLFQTTQPASYLPRWTLLACRSLHSFLKQLQIVGS